MGLVSEITSYQGTGQGRVFKRETKERARPLRVAKLLDKTMAPLLTRCLSTMQPSSAVEQVSKGKGCPNVKVSPSESVL